MNKKIKVCPKCSYPISSGLDLGSTDVACPNCSWSGGGHLLIERENTIKVDEKNLEKLYEDLGMRVSPLVAKILLEHELLSKETTPENYHRVAEVLALVTRSTFVSILMILFGEIPANKGEEIHKNAN